MDWNLNTWGVAPLLAYTEGEVWRPGIGDPTVMGWVTVVFYFLGALVCARVSFLVSDGEGLRKREGRVWLLLALALGFLGVNKQLDLQTWLTLTAKQMALAQGWYEGRRLVQIAFVLGVGAAGLWVLRWFWRNRSEFRHTPGAMWLALAGFVFLGCFILIRAASFHHVDAFLKWGPGSLRMNWVLEIGGIIMLTCGALKRGGAVRSSGVWGAPLRRASAP